MNDKEIFIEMNESSRTEFKRELSENLERSVIAFLNYQQGGVIYLGIDDSGMENHSPPWKTRVPRFCIFLLFVFLFVLF
jgi:predicted HTH transcriptional regulator